MNDQHKLIKHLNTEFIHKVSAYYLSLPFDPTYLEFISIDESFHKIHNPLQRVFNINFKIPNNELLAKFNLNELEQIYLDHIKPNFKQSDFDYYIYPNGQIRFTIQYKLKSKNHDN